MQGRIGEKSQAATRPAKRKRKWEKKHDRPMSPLISLHMTLLEKKGKEVVKRGRGACKKERGGGKGHFLSSERITLTPTAGASRGKRGEKKTVVRILGIRRRGEEVPSPAIRAIFIPLRGRGMRRGRGEGAKREHILRGAIQSAWVGEKGGGGGG